MYIKENRKLTQTLLELLQKSPCRGIFFLND